MLDLYHSDFVLRARNYRQLVLIVLLCGSSVVVHDGNISDIHVRVSHFKQILFIVKHWPSALGVGMGGGDSSTK